MQSQNFSLLQVHMPDADATRALHLPASSELPSAISPAILGRISQGKALLRPIRAQAIAPILVSCALH